MESVNVTTDHTFIRDWANKNNAKPEVVENGPIPIVRLDFPGKDDDAFLPANAKTLEGNWDVFFKHFEKQKLAFELDGSVADPSLAYRFVKRDAPIVTEENQM